MTDPILDHDRRDVYRLVIEYTADSIFSSAVVLVLVIETDIESQAGYYAAIDYEHEHEHEQRRLQARTARNRGTGVGLAAVVEGTIILPGPVTGKVLTCGREGDAPS